ncbi:MAG: hypothetical protein A3F95_03185 [Candidatus Nealsonbacteria bacterium RIFCSPLOWO2_12_FULL_39_31]|uniref:Uncharacterized protein n=3 Tax=Candidatus Nealsoniibacteriota TaxID=1817911 RepID=A0A1G2EKQ5_9BACT|nr:MAG: hypothetical protein A2626_00175 [Candidatus Nealsonbacteria bacterium RIFCSPHIGHO2_01_FULL_38_55]OGZ22188.1 MAG: hypothetical protein A3C48_00425 [Candidatus Nealsonbacteria bacterium RIFCSPHIGHO2_02_FULL_38_75]OGZ22767.1 MAG: hypothetical protein A2981_01595 [Candidatus Nealsonbacteria bacterium RIFCSPLOWO2_01_FULL_38_120]OGZ26363.1 MAG: hypothetical protein A2W71_02235 [Candidatus Nealsonbacteria bacterium RIFCSPLOWO2_02_39_8]OGZ26513.1 MAG: hypothetical protein A3F95_03185 [Candidat
MLEEKKYCGVISMEDEEEEEENDSEEEETDAVEEESETTEDENIMPGTDDTESDSDVNI